MQLYPTVGEVVRKYVAEDWQVCHLVPTADYTHRLYCRDSRSVYAACAVVGLFRFVKK